MRFPVITLEDKKTGKQFALTDEAELFRLCKRDNALKIFDMCGKEDSPFILADVPVTYYGITDLIRLYYNEEVKTLGEDIQKEYQKFIKKYEDLSHKISAARMEKMQNSIFTIEDFFYVAGIDVEEVENKPAYATSGSISLEQWDIATKEGYRLAKSLVKQHISADRIEDYIPDMEVSMQALQSQIVYIYYRFCKKEIDMTEGKRLLDSLKERYL